MDTDDGYNWDVYFNDTYSIPAHEADFEDDWHEPQPYHCSKCGAELEDHWKPCKGCGDAD